MAETGQQPHQESLLESQLQAYVAQGLYPMHMPGHKRQSFGDLPYEWDVTEVPGTDDLHHATGILAEAMQRTAELYGVSKTWYLVNGSTVGLLSGIRAIAPYGSEVIIARNCHKAVYHAIELQDLHVHWIWPHRDSEFDIYEGIGPAEIADALEQNPDSKAVILTSPTYEGIVSDIRGIAEVCHRHTSGAHPQGVPLLVDEAHGAHLGFHDFFPDSAVRQGADVVIQSPHKTLPSLTQTAWMHLPQGSLVDPDAIERELDVFETSSPSYPLMVSLDTCTGILREHGDDLCETYVTNMRMILQPVLDGLEHLQAFGWNYGCDDRQIYDADPSKILISGRGCEIDGRPCTGAYLAEILREEFHVETEMHLGWNVLAMTSICDSAEGLQRLADALSTMDRRAKTNEKPYNDSGLTDSVNISEACMTIADATRLPQERVAAEQAVGRIAAEYVYAYPPGIPVAVPGERITAEALQEIADWSSQGATIIHSARRDGYVVVTE